MPRLAKFIFKHLIIGIAAGWVILAGILYFNLGGLGALIFTSPIKIIPLLAIAALFAITFGPAAVATAVLMGDEFKDDGSGDDNDDGGRGVLVDNFVLAPARAQSKH